MAKAASKKGRSKASSSSRSRKGKGKGKAALRSRKDRRRPKRALGPYMFFCKQERKNICAHNPNLSFVDVGRALGSEWSRLSDKDKKKYVKKAEADKRRYDKEMKRYRD